MSAATRLRDLSVRAKAAFRGGDIMVNRFVSRVIALAAAGVLAVSLGAVSTQAASAAVQEPGTFVSLDPTRVLDTRVGNGAPQRAVAAFGTIDLQIAGRGGVPTTGVAAVVVNVTVTSPTAHGFVTVYPTGGAQPTASNLNFSAQETIPNLVTVKVGDTGRISLTNNAAGSSHLIADVAGYYLAGEATTPGAFVSLEPSRILDTRIGNGAAGSTPVWGTVGLQVAGRGGVPESGVSAVVMNVTVTSPSAGGFLTVYPTGAAVPSASALNFTRGQTVPNLVTVALGRDGQVSLLNNSAGSAHLIADVAGYYLEGTPTAPGAFVALDSPTRFLDTRTSNVGPWPMGAWEWTSTQITDRATIGMRAEAAVMNITVTNTSAHGFITSYPFGSEQPTASNVNFTAQQTIPNMSIVRVGANGRIEFSNNSAGSLHLIADVAGYFLADPSEPGVVWPWGWVFDDCGRDWDGIILLETPGLTYTPFGEPFTWDDGDLYREFYADRDGYLTVTAHAEPGFVLETGPFWTVQGDGLVTGTFTFTDQPCASQWRAAAEPSNDAPEELSGRNATPVEK